MSRHLMATDAAILHDMIPRTVKLIFHAQHPLFKRGGCRHNLEGRARFIRIADTVVSPHLVAHILRNRLVRLIVQCKRIIQVIFRHIRKRIDLSILRIHHNDTDTLCLFLLKHFQCFLRDILLDIYINRGDQILSGCAFHSPLCPIFNFFPPGIRQGIDTSCFSHEQIIIINLQTDNTLIVTACKS